MSSPNLMFYLLQTNSRLFYMQMMSVINGLRRNCLCSVSTNYRCFCSRRKPSPRLSSQAEKDSCKNKIQHHFFLIAICYSLQLLEYLCSLRLIADDCLCLTLGVTRSFPLHPFLHVTHVHLLTIMIKHIVTDPFY